MSNPFTFTHFKRAGAILCLALAAALLVAAVLISTQQVGASSHREAPLLSKDQFADTTDTYVFISPDDSDNIVFAASWIPFEGAEGGPNYYEWDDNALYDIFVDNDGDAVADITYTLSSEVVLENPLTFLYNTNTIDSLDDADWNRKQYYTVTQTTEDGMTTVLVDGELAPPVNIGSKSTPNYEALSNAAIYTNGDTKVFAGQTDDAFWVDLQVFDLLTLRGQEPPVGYGSGNNIPVDSLSGFNVHSLVIETPIASVTADGDPVVGVWAGTRRPAMRVLDGPLGLGGQTHSGDYVQVSRLGMPLVNEAVLPIVLKDPFNSIDPSFDLQLYTDALDGALGVPGVGDLTQLSVEDPELGRLLCGLYGVPLPGDTDSDCSTEVDTTTPRSGRGDIFDIFLTGMVLENEFTITTADGPFTLPVGFNVNRPSDEMGNPDVVPAEMIRINTAIKDDLCAPTPNRLGVLGGDACGFPNGRRLMDDVVEIELLAVAGAAYEVLDDSDTAFSFNPAFIEVLDDGLDGNDKAFRDTFPYFAVAHSGQEHQHENPLLYTYLPSVSTDSGTLAQTISENPVEAAAATVGSAALLGLPALFWLRRRRDEDELV